MDWSWAGPPIDARPLFPLERAELIALLEDLAGDDWRRPTVCPGWCAHDIVAHIVHDYVRKLARSRDGHESAGPRQAEDLAAFLHRVNQEFVDVSTPWSPRVLIDLLGHLGPQLDAYWAGLEMDRRGEPVSWAAPDEPAPAWLDIAREYSEYWVHQQQIRDAVGRPGADEDRLVRPVVDVFLRAVPYALRDVPATRGASVDIAVYGPGGGNWVVSRDDAGWSIGHGAAARQAAARVTLSSDTLWRVATRGIGVETALANARITGDRALAAAAMSLVSIIR